jgi:hypothetical protein
MITATQTTHSELPVKKTDRPRSDHAVLRINIPHSVFVDVVRDIK